MNLAKQKDTKSKFRSQWRFCITTMKYQKQKLGNIPIYYGNKKNNVPRNKFNQGDKIPVLGKL